MEKKLVVYSNDFNFMPLPILTELEMNLFINIICNIKKSREFKCSFDDFYKQVNDKRNLVKEEIIAYFKEFANKLLKYAIEFSVKDREYSLFVCFEKIQLIKEKDNTYTLIVKIQEDFFDLITNQQLGFTQFELCEFMSITGKYAKSLYRLLKQFRNTGKVLCFTQDWQKFCELMQIPETYTLQSNIDNRIINPAITELSKYFKNLRYQKIKDTKSKGRGGKVIGIEFYFKAEKEPIKAEEKTSKPNSKPKKIYITETETNIKTTYFKTEEEKAEYIRNKAKKNQNTISNINSEIAK